MITDEHIKESAKSIAGKIITLSPLERKIFEQLAFNGAKWMQEQTKQSFLSFIQSTELSHKDKDLVKGVFYGWIGR